jgi:hypothetical protein
MHRPALMRLALGVAMVMLALSGCGNGSAQQEEAKPRPLPEELRELRPGEYRSDEFEPPFSFRVGEGWTNEAPEMSDALFLTRGHERWLGFASVQEVFIYNPTKTSSPNVVEAPEDMVGWFMRHPHLRTSEPEWVKVGGSKGVRFDAVVRDLPEDYFGECGSGCVDLFRVGGAYPIYLWEKDRASFVVMEDVEGETVTVSVFSPAAEFDDHAPEAQKVLDTVQWRGS